MQDKWQVIFYKDKNGDEPVKDFIMQEIPSARAYILGVIELLANHNISLGMPFVKKVDKSGLRELRIRHSSHNYRIFFFVYHGKQFILLHVFKKKSNKIPRGHIEIALKRMQHHIERHRDEQD